MIHQHSRHLLSAAAAFLILTASGCALGPSGPGGPSLVQVQAAPPEERAVTEPAQAAPPEEHAVTEPAKAAPEKKPAEDRTEPLSLQPSHTPRVVKKAREESSQARKPAEKAAPGKVAAAPTPARARCKVRSDAVAWTHVEGGCRNGYADDAGKAISVNGKRTYTGMFKDGYFSGQGNYAWGDGITYSGGFARSRKNGSGTIAYPDGSSYTGGFRDNRYDGEGTYRAGDGDTYAGSFVKGHYHGRGTYTWTNGDRYTGEFNNDRMEGAGTFTLHEGGEYAGRFKNSMMHGRGTYTWPNGDRYIGEFRDDTMNGNGEYIYAGGMRYEGGFRDGRKDGDGTLFTAEGPVEQVWKNGEKVSEQVKGDSSAQVR